MRSPDREPEYDMLLLVVLIGAAVLSEIVPSLPGGALALGALALSAVLWAFHRLVVLRATITIRCRLWGVSRRGAWASISPGRRFISRKPIPA